GPSGMPRDMDMRLPVGDDQRADVAQRVHDPAYGDLIARNLLRREDDGVAFGELQLMLAERDPAQRGAWLTLAAGGDDQQFLARQAHRILEPDRLREIAEIAGGFGDPQDTIETAAGDADLAPGLDRHPADRFQPRRIGSEGGDQHPSFRRHHRFKQSSMDPGFAARGAILEDVGRVAHQRQHAGIADVGHRFGRAWLAEHGRLVDLPVAGVEDITERRLDQQAITFGDRVRQRDVGYAERIEVDRSAALDHPQRDLPS